jgi:hypothetical protein
MVTHIHHLFKTKKEQKMLTTSNNNKLHNFKHNVSQQQGNSKVAIITNSKKQVGITTSNVMQ